MPKKIIITDELKEILFKVESDISNVLLKEEIEDNLLRPDKGINYLDISHTQKGHISYLTYSKIQKIEESEDKNYWEKKARYHGRPGSVVKKMFIGFGDYEIENFTNQFMSIIDPPVFRMEVVKGDNISKYYHHTTYYNMNGSLGASCMKASPASFFDIYVNNPEQINMLIMFDQHDKVMGRAILWPTINVMDRIYVNNDIHVNYFYNWAKEKNYHYKQYNNWYTPKQMVFNGDPIIKELELSLENSKFEHYPYLDTFKWLDLDNKKLYNYIPKDTKLITISDHMGSYFREDHFGFCEMSNELCNRYELAHLDYLDKKVKSGNCYYSKPLEKNIWSEHSKMISIFKNEKYEINEYIFNEEYDHLNDKYKIEEYKKKMQEMVNSGKDPRKNPHHDVYQPHQPPRQQLEEEPHHHVPTEEEQLEYEAWLAEEERNSAEYMAMSDEDRRRMAQQQIEELMR